MHRVSNYDLDQAGFSEEKAKLFFSIPGRMLFPAATKERRKREKFLKYQTSCNEYGFHQWGPGLQAKNEFEKSYSEGLEVAGLYCSLLLAKTLRGSEASERRVSYIAQEHSIGGGERLRKLIRRYRSVSHFWMTYWLAREESIFCPCDYDTRNSKKYFIDHFGEFFFFAAGFREELSCKIGNEYDKKNLWMPRGWENFSKSCPSKPKIDFKDVAQLSKLFAESFTKYKKEVPFLMKKE